jgi:hypothetical protein
MKMISERSFQNASVPELIRMIKEEFAGYKQKEDPARLKEILGHIEEAGQILLRALRKAGPNDRKRIEEIQKKQREVDELKKQIGVL